MRRLFALMAVVALMVVFSMPMVNTAEAGDKTKMNPCAAKAKGKDMMDKANPCAAKAKGKDMMDKANPCAAKSSW